MNKFTFGLVTEIKNASLIHFAEGVSEVIEALNDRYREYIGSDIFRNKVAQDAARNDRRRTTVAWTEHEIAKLLGKKEQLAKGNIIKVAGTRDGHGMRIFQGFDQFDRLICTKLEQQTLISVYKDADEVYFFDKRFYVAGWEATTHAPGKVRRLFAAKGHVTKPVTDWEGKHVSNRVVQPLTVERDFVKEVRK